MNLDFSNEEKEFRKSIQCRATTVPSVLQNRRYIAPAQP